MSRRTVYLCDWLPPDFGAVGQYALAAAREMARGGRLVTLAGLSSRGDAVVEERVGSGQLTVVRLATDAYDRADLRARAGWTLRANLRLLAASWGAIRRADEVVFTGSPPFLIHLLMPLAPLLRAKLVYRITDFHPECLIAELGRAPLWLRALRRWTVFLRRRVDRFEALGEDQRTRLLEIGVPPGRIELARDDSPVAIGQDTRPLERPSPLKGMKVLLYSGNFGVAHDDSTFLAGYRRHHETGSGRVALWLNATGAKADRVARALLDSGLPVHRSRPVPIGQLARLLVTPDAHLITLRDEFVGYVLPSKVYGCIRSGRPVLFVGSAASDVDLLCRERMPAGSYRRVAVGDVEGVAAALEEIAARGGSEASAAISPEIRASAPLR